MSSKGILLALSTVLVWAILNVVNRFCVLSYGTNVMVFTAFMIFSTGISLMLIRQPVTTGNWKSGVKYSWLYTIMQIIRSFTMISTFLYITSTETSLLFNIEIIITYILAYAFFRRIPYKGDYLGILVILTGFTLFIFTLPEHQRTIVSILILISATAQLHPFHCPRRNAQSGHQRLPSGKNAGFRVTPCFTGDCISFCSFMELPCFDSSLMHRFPLPSTSFTIYHPWEKCSIRKQ